MKTPHARLLAGFTLIELLVVISIIAILAAISLPVMKGVIVHARQADAVASARGIGLALQMRANDADGIFPAELDGEGSPILSANDAFRDLLPTYIDDERIFAVSSSSVGRSADGKIDPRAEILKPGENHFAYIAGLTTSAPSTWPLVVDGTDGSGTYVSETTKPGGVWAGDKAVVISVSTSARLVPLRGEKDARFIPRTDDPQQNALTVSAYMGDEAKLLEPLGK